MRRLIAALPFSMLACHTQTSDAPGLEISTAALTLDGVTEACYDLAVHAGPNTASPLVWSREGVCASRFGDGVGAISYVGPCDASTPAHTVQLVLATLYAGAALDDQTTSSDPDFINPCPAPNGCTLPATCAPNTDTPVRFDLTLMRPAGQGFFDIAVDLDDVFCSAKADCASSTGPLELLHNPRLTGAPRDQTLVMGLTCTAGPDTDTRIHWLDAAIVCGGVTYDLLAGMVDNTAGLQGPIEPSGIGTSSLVFEHAYYLGEQAPYAGVFTNLAVGLDTRFLGLGAHTGCRLEARATVSEGPLGDTTRANSRYPIVTWDIPLNTGNNAALLCSQHPLDGGNGLATAYTPITPTGEPIAFTVDGNGAGQVSIVDVGYTPPPDPNASPEDLGVVTAPHLFITQADGALRLGYVVDSVPTSLQRFIIVDENLQALGRSGAGPSTGSVVGSYTVTAFVNCAGQTFIGTPGATYRFILANEPNNPFCPTFNAQPRSTHLGDFTAIARASVATPASFPSTGLTLTLAAQGGNLHMTTNVTGTLGTNPTVIFADPNFGPALEIGRISAQGFNATGATGPVQLVRCSNGQPINVASPGTREYLAFIVDSPVACGGIAALNFRNTLVSSGFVKLVVP
jgi:hypothetical protein